MKLKDVKTGERLSFTNYMEVVSKDTNSIKVKDVNGQEFTIKGKDFIENSVTSAAQFEKEEKVNRTAMVEALLGAKDSVFTARFTKQDGSDRIMVARLVNSENLMGRSNVIDLEATGQVVKQIDHRTIYELTLKGVKYLIKK